MITPYQRHRMGMSPGDIVAFASPEWPGNFIQWWTGWNVSHIAVVSKVPNMSELYEPGSEQIVLITESTSLDGRSGVSETRLSQRIEEYNGNMWWLPRGLTDEQARIQQDWLRQQIGKPYDTPAALEAGLDFLGDYGINDIEIDDAAFMCVELSARSDQESGAYKHTVAAVDITPGQYCAYPMFAGPAIQLTGEPTEIMGYNGTAVR